MRVIVTGSRRWDKRQVVYDALADVYRTHGAFTLVHGACSTGADHIAHVWWLAAGKLLGVGEVQYRAEWEKYGRAAGPRRNTRMIQAGADLVLAFPKLGGSGTQHTMALAEAAHIPIKEYK